MKWQNVQIQLESNWRDVNNEIKTTNNNNDKSSNNRKKMENHSILVTAPCLHWVENENKQLKKYAGNKNNIALT